MTPETRHSLERANHTTVRVLHLFYVKNSVGRYLNPENCLSLKWANRITVRALYLVHVKYGAGTSDLRSGTAHVPCQIRCGNMPPGANSLPKKASHVNAINRVVSRFIHGIPFPPRGGYADLSAGNMREKEFEFGLVGA